jgi:hypothetical protein
MLRTPNKSIKPFSTHMHQPVQPKATVTLRWTLVLNGQIAPAATVISYCMLLV